MAATERAKSKMRPLLRAGQKTTAYFINPASNARSHMARGSSQYPNRVAEHLHRRGLEPQCMVVGRTDRLADPGARNISVWRSAGVLLRQSQRCNAATGVGVWCAQHSDWTDSWAGHRGLAPPEEGVLGRIASNLGAIYKPRHFAEIQNEMRLRLIHGIW